MHLRRKKKKKKKRCTYVGKKKTMHLHREKQTMHLHGKKQTMLLHCEEQTMHLHRKMPNDALTSLVRKRMGIYSRRIHVVGWKGVLNQTCQMLITRFESESRIENFSDLSLTVLSISLPH